MRSGQVMRPDQRARVHSAIRRLYGEGKTWRAIAAETGVSSSTVRNALKGHTTNRYNRGPGLTAEDHDRIERFAERGLGPTTIAARIGRNESTIRWYMCSRGLRVFGKPGKKSPNGGRAFDAEEDAFIVECRLEGHSFRRIAEMVFERFGWERPLNSIRFRLAMLATQDAA